MRCPKCGNELLEGKLLCEYCGEEVKYVQDFDIELEHELRKSISSIMEELAESKDAQEPLPVNNKAADTNALFAADDELKDRLSDYFSGKRIDFLKNKKARVITITAVIVMTVVIVVLIGVFGILRRMENSYAYQYEKAIKAASDNRYSEAVSYLERAVEIDASETDARFLLAEYYGRSGMRTSEIYALSGIIAQYPDYPRRGEVYDRLLAIYEEDKDYEKIAETLADCDVERIAAKYGKYAASQPRFNKEGGEYDEIISITLNGSTDGTVYYTMDGTKPTVNSFEYKTPILLESGDYTISAVFVNVYGIMGDAVSQSYRISPPIPDSPVVSLDSGTYNEPALIEVFHKDNTKIYYTLDGSIPDQNSTRYGNPIEMPCGISNFSFAAIDGEGIRSEVVSRSYNLKIEANFDMETALQVLKNNLAILGKLSNPEGNVPDMLGRSQYRVQTVARIDEALCYIVYEEYADAAGSVHDANEIYAIDAGTGQLYYAYKIDEGKYNLKPFDE